VAAAPRYVLNERTASQKIVVDRRALIASDTSAAATRSIQREDRIATTSGLLTEFRNDLVAHDLLGFLAVGRTKIID
jgi:hypothetical protein